MLEAFSPAIADDDTIDLLTELINIGVGRAAAALSELTECRIELTVPSLRIAQANGQLFSTTGCDQPTSTIVIQECYGDICGHSALAFPCESGLTLASILAGVEAVESELDIELHGVLLELGNILLNHVIGALSNEAGVSLSFALPTVHSGSDLIEQLLRGQSEVVDQIVVEVQFRLHQRKICGSILIALENGSIDQLVKMVRDKDSD